MLYQIFEKIGFNIAYHRISIQINIQLHIKLILKTNCVQTIKPYWEKNSPPPLSSIPNVLPIIPISIRVYAPRVYFSSAV